MPTDLHTLTAELRALGGGRVWSLMISLFGDLAQGEGDVIAGPVLSQIMTGLGVKPEAARVALHRLRRDGWIVSVKSGRISRHSLTAEGRRQSAAASPRIYAQPAQGKGNWQIILLQDGAAQAGVDFVQIQPRLLIGPADADIPKNALRLEAAALPDWLRSELADADLKNEFAKLDDALTRFAQDLPAPETLASQEVALLRCLIVHNWRRLVLKNRALPPALIDTDGPQHRCHVRVADLLDHLHKPSLATIEQEYAAL